MRKPEDYRFLIQFAGFLESELLTSLLESVDISFRVTEVAKHKSTGGISAASPISIQVLNEDLHRAKVILAGYRKTQGVPFS